MNITSNNLPAVRDWLLQNNYEAILKMASRRKHTLSLLTALTYDSDQEVSDRAVKATGLAAKQIADHDPDFVHNYLRRLFWLVNDESGGVCWRAPELIGEIIHNCPQFSQFRPMLISLLDGEREVLESTHTQI